MSEKELRHDSLNIRLYERALKGVSPYIRAKFRMLLSKGNISREHSERIRIFYCVERAIALRFRRFASGLALQRVSGAVTVLIKRESYGQEDPSRALLASERALSARVWVS